MADKFNVTVTISVTEPQARQLKAFADEFYEGGVSRAARAALYGATSPLNVIKVPSALPVARKSRKPVTK